MTDKNNASEHDKKLAEVRFLADEFGVAPDRAAALVTDAVDEADALARETLAAEQARDSLAGLQVPGPDKDPEHIEEAVADLGKPVVHEESAPT